jgi:hypothetical protein
VWALRLNSILLFYFFFGAQSFSGFLKAENQIKKSDLQSEKRAFFSVLNSFSSAPFPALLLFNLFSDSVFGESEAIDLLVCNSTKEEISFSKNLGSSQEINLSNECAFFEKVDFFGEYYSSDSDLPRETNIPDEDLSDEEETTSEKNNFPEENDSAEENDSLEETDFNEQPAEGGNDDIISPVFYEFIRYSSLKSIFLASNSSLPKRKAIPLFILYHSWKGFL